MNVYLVLTVILFFFQPHALSAQSPYQVSYAILQDTLTVQDEFSPEIGRFDVFEFDLNTGDKIDIELISPHFIPTLVLLSPSDSVYTNLPSGSLTTIHFSYTIEETGKWLVLVIGDSASSGAYLLKCRWASAQALRPSEEADFCDQVDFLLAHLNADFAFLKEPPLPGEEKEVWTPTYILDGALEAIITDPRAEKYEATMYSGNNPQNAESIYQSLLGKLRFCLGEKWKMESSPWQVGNAITPYKIRYTKFTEANSPAARFITIKEFDYRSTPGISPYQFIIKLIFDRQ
ncbi:MAG: hypothetical protein D6748_06150 [Calditrichaeota bacterium]|nr:MAG: hypothetical protein D6748_06150 [Calditrichota bacterium]